MESFRGGGGLGKRPKAGEHVAEQQPLGIAEHSSNGMYRSQEILHFP